MQDIQTALLEIPMFSGRDMAARRINGGITNINWRVTDRASGDTYFVKLHGAGTEAFIDRDTALAAARIAAEKGVGPQVFYHDVEKGVEVHEFLDAFRSCGVHDVLEPQVRQAIMSAYKDVHDSLVLDRADTGLNQFETFVDRVVGKCGPLPADIQHLVWQCRRGKAAIEASGIDLRGCYNDSYISNYMRNDMGEIRIIDWEYAANNDPYWDIGMFGIESFFDDRAGVANLLEMYEGHAREDLVARTYLYIGIAMIRWGLWAVWQSSHSEIAFDFAKYSRLLLMRGRRQTSAPDWEWALSKV